MNWLRMVRPLTHAAYLCHLNSLYVTSWKTKTKIKRRGKKQLPRKQGLVCGRHVICSFSLWREKKVSGNLPITRRIVPSEFCLSSAIRRAWSSNEIPRVSARPRVQNENRAFRIRYFRGFGETYVEKTNWHKIDFDALFSCEGRLKELDAWIWRAFL